MTAVQFSERNNYFSISVLFCHACHHLCANNSKITQVLQHAMRVRGQRVKVSHKVTAVRVRGQRVKVSHKVTAVRVRGQRMRVSHK